MLVDTLSLNNLSNVRKMIEKMREDSDYRFKYEFFSPSLSIAELLGLDAVEKKEEV